MMKDLMNMGFTGAKNKKVISRMIKEMDENQNGQIEKEEFIEFFLKNFTLSY